MLALLAAAAAGAPGIGTAESGTGDGCVADSDCVAVLCPCNWIPISKTDQEGLADCRVLQEISRCGNITPDGRPAVACRAGVCVGANDAVPDPAPPRPDAARAPSTPAAPLAPSDDAGEGPLVDSGALYDGMTRDHAVRILGEPALESADHIEWRYDSSATAGEAGTVSAAKRGDRLYDWRGGEP